MATTFREVFQDRLIRIPPKPEGQPTDLLEADLHSVKKEVGTTGATRLVAARSETDAHADRFWAAALAIAGAKSAIGPFEGISTGTRSVGSTLAPRPEIDSSRGLILSPTQQEMMGYG